MKKTIVASTLAALGLGFALTASAGTIAVVNVKQILEQSPRVKTLNANLQKKFKPQQATLEADQKALKKEMDDMKRNASVMSKTEKAKKEAKIKEDQAAFIKKASLFQSKLQAAQQNVMKHVFESMSGVIADVAKKDKYDVVVDSAAVAYRNPSVDISKQVAKAFNSEK